MIVKIIKNKKVVDSCNNFTYVVEFYLDNVLVKKDIIKIPPTDYMTPDEGNLICKETLFANLEQLQYSLKFELTDVTFEVEEI